MRPTAPARPWEQALVESRASRVGAAFIRVLHGVAERSNPIAPRAQGSGAGGSYRSWFAVLRCLWGASLAVACAGSEVDTGAEPTDIRFWHSEHVGTVLRVNWTTPHPTRGYVSYGTTMEASLNTPMEAVAAQAHDVTLRGLTPETEYFVRIVTWTGADTGASDVWTFRTGALPAGLPALAAQGEPPDGVVLLPLRAPTPAVVVLDGGGRVVWAHVDASGQLPYRARWAQDGQGIVYSTVSAAQGVASGALVRLDFHGNVLAQTPIGGLVGDFVERPDGTFAAIATEVRDVGGTPTRGDGIVEIDAAGTVTQVWSPWDCFDPIAHPGFGAADGWAVVGGLQLDPSLEAYYVGISSFGSVVRVNRSTKACEWVLGQTAATLEPNGAMTPFTQLRQFEAQPTRVALVASDSGGALRALEYRIDPIANQATEVLSLPGPAVSEQAPSLGEPSRLTSSAVLVNWASEGRLEVTGTTGTSWAVTAPVGVTFGLHALAHDFYSTP